MKTMMALVNDNQVRTTLPLSNGVAENMGEGVFVVFQEDDRGVAQSVVLTAKDLEALLAAR